jgi:hypothetical protein
MSLNRLITLSPVQKNTIKKGLYAQTTEISDRPTPDLTGVLSPNPRNFGKSSNSTAYLSQNQIDLMPIQYSFVAIDVMCASPDRRIEELSAWFKNG